MVSHKEICFLSCHLGQLKYGGSGSSEMVQMSFGKDYNQKSNPAVINYLNQNPHQTPIETTIEKGGVLVSGEESSVVTNEVDRLLLSLAPLPENETLPLVQEELKLPNQDLFQEQGHEVHEVTQCNYVSKDKEDMNNYIFY